MDYIEKKRPNLAQIKKIYSINAYYVGNVLVYVGWGIFQLVTLQLLVSEINDHKIE